MVTPEPESAFRGFPKPIAAPLETLERLRAMDVLIGLYELEPRLAPQP